MWHVRTEERIINPLNILGGEKTVLIRHLESDSGVIIKRRGGRPYDDTYEWRYLYSEIWNGRSILFEFDSVQLSAKIESINNCHQVMLFTFPGCAEAFDGYDTETAFQLVCNIMRNIREALMQWPNSGVSIFPLPKKVVFLIGLWKRKNEFQNHQFPETVYRDNPFERPSTPSVRS